MSVTALGAPVAMAALATASVGLWTLRVALTARGRKAAGAIAAAVEAVVFAIAFTRLGSDLGAPDRLGGYAVGVAGGTLLGLLLDERLSRGQSEVRVVAPGLQPCLVQRLHRDGWPVTGITGDGPDGPVTQLFVAADDRRLPVLLEEVRRAVPGAAWTVHRLGGATSRSALTGSAPPARRRSCRHRASCASGLDPVGKEPRSHGHDAVPASIACGT